MKKNSLLLLIILLFESNCFTQQGWIQQAPFPTSGDLESIQFLSEDTFIVGGTNGIIKTTDGGITWNKLKLPNQSSPYSFHFFSMQNCIILSNGDVYETTDNGHFWEKKNIDHLGLSSDSRFQFLTDSTGYLEIGTKLLKTTDRGRNWITLPMDFPSYIDDYYFIDALNGYVAVNNNIYRTTNGGSSWQIYSVSQTYFHISSIYFTDINNGVVTGDSKVYFTNNGGITWMEKSTGFLINPQNIYMTDLSTIFVAGFNNSLLRSSDGGVTWSSLFSTENLITLNKIRFFNQNTGVVVGNKGMIYLTKDGGLTWKLITSGRVQTLDAVCFTSATTGFAGGDYQNTMLKTTDGGNYWKKVNVPTDNYYFINSIFFIDSGHGFAACDNGYKIFTTDAGENWAVQDPTVNFDLLSIYFINSNIGFAVGEGGAIFKTTNSGNTWISQSCGFSGKLNQIFFFDEYNGIIAADSGTIIKTTNAGSNWIREPAISSDNFVEMSFPVRDTGYIASKQGQIVKTTDGGITWHNISQIHQYGNVTSLFFPSPGTGYAYIEYYGLYKTTDGGHNWLEQSYLGDYDFYALFFNNNDTGYAVGEQGAIYKTTNGGYRLPDSAGIIHSLDSSVCPGGYGYYNIDPVNFATSYSWSYNGTVFSNYQSTSCNISFNGSVNSGTLTVTPVNSYGQGTSSPEFTILIHEKPQTPVVTLLSNDSLVSSPAYSYQWYYNYWPVQGATDSIITSDVVGPYYVITTNEFGCFSNPSNIYFLAVEELSNNISVKIIPNPALWQIELSTNNNLITDILIYNSSGKIAMSQKVNNKSQLKVNIGSFSPGIYLVMLQTTKGKTFKKFIKE